VSTVPFSCMVMIVVIVVRLVAACQCHGCDAYEQENAACVLDLRFHDGGLCLGIHKPCQSISSCKSVDLAVDMLKNVDISPQSKMPPKWYSLMIGVLLPLCCPLLTYHKAFQDIRTVFTFSHRRFPEKGPPFAFPGAEHPPEWYQYSSVNAKVDLRYIHCPLVKSGKATVWLPISIDCSLSGVMALHAAAS
jgi:hypothetical protein